MPKNEADVERFLADLEHPLKAEIGAVREIFLAADPRVAEGIKWKAPSFFYNDWFATFHLRTTTSVQVILHTGAKVKASRVDGLNVADPAGLLKWLAKNRCSLTLATMDEIRARRPQIEAIVRQWLAHM